MAEEPTIVNTSALGLRPFRLAFAQVFKGKVNNLSGKVEYGFTLLIPKTEAEALLPFRKAAKAALVKQFGEDKTNWPKRLRAVDLRTHLSPGGDGWPIRDGDIQGYEGFEGMAAIGAKSYEPFGVVGPDLTPLTQDSAIKVASGMLAHAVVKCSAYNMEVNKGVSFWAQALQIVKDDGTRYGGRVNAAKAFTVYVDPEGDDGWDNPENYNSTGTDDEL